MHPSAPRPHPPISLPITRTSACCLSTLAPPCHLSTTQCHILIHTCTLAGTFDELGVAASWLQVAPPPFLSTYTYTHARTHTHTRRMCMCMCVCTHACMRTKRTTCVRRARKYAHPHARTRMRTHACANALSAHTSLSLTHLPQTFPDQPLTCSSLPDVFVHLFPDPPM